MSDEPFAERIVGRRVVAVDDTYGGRHGFTLTFDDGTVMVVEAEKSFDQALIEIRFERE